MARGKFVSYLRVSTDKQGRSGLGVEAQREAVARYLNGGTDGLGMRESGGQFWSIRASAAFYLDKFCRQ